MQTHNLMQELRQALIEDIKLITKYLSLSQAIQTVYAATHDAKGKRLLGANVKSLKAKQKLQAEIGITILRNYVRRIREIETNSDTFYAEWWAENLERETDAQN